MSFARIALLVLFLLPGCALHSTAKEWHGRVGPDGKPVYVMTTTKIGFNLLVFLPLFGHTSVPGMVEEMTSEIKAGDGDKVRFIQASSENYWHGWPPLTWIITPVISETAAEFQPSAEQLAQDRELWETLPEEPAADGEQ